MWGEPASFKETDCGGKEPSSWNSLGVTTVGGGLACRVRSAVDKSELIKKYMPPCGQSWPEGPIRVGRTFLGKQKTASRGL